MKAIQSILPAASSSGGTRVGSTFIGAWKTCPYLWYAEYLAPVKGGGHGYESQHMAEPLFIGDLVHYGLEGWVRSSWQDCRYDAEAGTLALNTRAQTLYDKVGSDENWGEWKAAAELLLERHMAWCGPDGPDWDGEHFEIVADADGEPLIEREFEIDLGHAGYFFTTKPDLVVRRKWDGKICALDHKTVDAAKRAQDFTAKRMSFQLTGEQYALAEWSGEVAGLLVNQIVKRAAKDKPPRHLEIADRNAARLEKFRLGMIRTLEQIDTAIEEYRDLMTKSVPEAEAARMVFDSEPTEDRCSNRWGRTCPFLDACESVTAPGDWVVGMKARFGDNQ